MDHTETRTAENADAGLGAVAGPPARPPAGAARRVRDVILFDGVCSLCNTGADWVTARDRAGNFDFLAYQSPEVQARFPGLDPARLAQEMHVVTADGEILRGVDAAARVLRRLPGWGWVGRLLGWRALAWLTRPAYRWLARRRRGLFGGRVGCTLGPP